MVRLGVLQDISNADQEHCGIPAHCFDKLLVESFHTGIILWLVWFITRGRLLYCELINNLCD